MRKFDRNERVIIRAGGSEVPRPQSIRDEELISRLSCVFRDVGYDGASLALLSKSTGLQKASLYHRFPRGKQQMAEEVVAAALTWYGDNIFAPLKGAEPPAVRLRMVASQLNKFYMSGQQSCLLNMLAAPRDEASPFREAIKGAFEATIVAFAALAREFGHTAKASRSRAERTVMLLHGSLVMSRGLGSSKPFQTFLTGLEHELIGS